MEQSDHKHHVEELAYHVYCENPDLHEVVPMLPPKGFDTKFFPRDSKVVWTYEPINRVVRADFFQCKGSNSSRD